MVGRAVSLHCPARDPLQQVVQAMLIDIGEIRLNYVEWGAGEETVVFIHGNLACGMWFDLVGPLVAQNFRVIAIDWRGCGGSDKPASLSDYSNYTIRQHAQDMLAAIRGLGIDRCHLATHSTGGPISSYMLLMEPERFGKVLALNPVGPMGLQFPAESFALFDAMKASRERTRATLALTLFRPETLATASQPIFDDHATLAQKQLFERLVDRTLQFPTASGSEPRPISIASGEPAACATNRG
jgi:pimeloyl-ACP methyl ester carboxylesterase